MENRMRSTLTSILNRYGNLRSSADGKVKDIVKEELVRPMLNALGYEGEYRPKVSFNTSENRCGTGKSNRVDYAVLYEDKPRIFIEVCHLSETLDSRVEYLAKCHENNSNVELSILTNGNNYRLYSTSVDDSSSMGRTPFMAFELKDLNDEILLEKFLNCVSKKGMETWMQYGGFLTVMRKNIDKKKIEDVISNLFSRTPDIDDDFIYCILKRAGIQIPKDRTSICEKYRDLIRSCIVQTLDFEYADMPEDDLDILMNSSDDLEAVENPDASGEIIEDDHSFDVTFANKEDSTNTRVDALYFDNKKIEINIKYRKPTMQDAILTMIRHLEQLHPGTLYYLASKDWRPRRSKHPFLTLSIDEKLSYRFEKLDDVYVYTNICNKSFLYMLEKLFDKYAVDGSLFRLSVHKYVKKENEMR